MRCGVVVPPQAKAPPRTLKDLAGADVQRIALGNPDSVPVGRYAKGALDAAGCGRQCGARPSPQNVRQSLDYVARGEVDAGFVYATDAQAMPDRAPRVRGAGVRAHRLSAGGDQRQYAAGRGQALRCLRAFAAGPGDPGQARVRHP